MFEIASGYRPRNGNMKKQRPSKEVKKALKGDNLL